MGSIRPRQLAAAVVLAAVLLLPGLGAHTLIDPWEGHYAEVGRRILADDDWVHLHWKDEVFRSKPALTPWLIAASLRAHGLAAGGGYSGELATSSRVAWAVRLPFALFGMLGLLAVWWMLARLVSLRAAWLGMLSLGLVPFYFLVARQAITDIPMVATTTAALACFAVAVIDGERPLRTWWRKLGPWHVWLAVLTVATCVQAIYAAAYFAADPHLGRGVRVGQPALVASLPFLAGLIAVAGIGWRWRVRTEGELLMLWGYTFIGVGILGKGPPGAALAVGVAAITLLATGKLSLIRRMRPIEGVLVVLLIAGPWHVAMALRDGQPWITRYIGYHWLARATDGVHQVNRAGEGTFTYYVHQLGIGLWPVVALLPGTFVAAFQSDRSAPRDRVRTIALVWALGGLVLFSAVRTKYHHYIVPAIPGVAILVALYLDDLFAGRARHVGIFALVGVALAALIAWDVHAQSARLIELFVYRYDRPWPAGPPWHLDLSAELLAFGAAFTVAASALCIARLRVTAALSILGAAALLALWIQHRYMPAIAPHWGQGQLHAHYVRERAVHGVELRYRSRAAAAGDFGGARSVRYRVAVPPGLEVGAPQRITIAVDGQRIVLPATITRIASGQITAAVSDAEARRLRARLATSPARSSERPQATVDVDRLITWNLFWRSEIFWSGGELWGPTADTHTAFRWGDDAGLKRYLARPESRGRRFFLITDAGQLGRLRSQLPPAARDTLEVLDRSSNKFVLVRFSLPDVTN